MLNPFVEFLERRIERESHRLLLGINDNISQVLFFRHDLCVVMLRLGIWDLLREIRFLFGDYMRESTFRNFIEEWGTLTKPLPTT